MKKVNLNKVIKFATEKHKGQFRKDGSPYINHPKRVCSIIEKYNNNCNIDDIKAGALLHDTLEDTKTSYKELKSTFGKTISKLVLEVTSIPLILKIFGKKKYLSKKMLHMSNDALIIKLADRLDNIIDIKCFSKEKIKKKFFDTLYIVHYLQAKRNLTNIHNKLINEIINQIQILNIKYKFTNDAF